MEENIDEIINDLVYNYLISEIESTVPSRKLRSYGRKRGHPIESTTISPSGQRRRPIRSIHLKKSSPVQDDHCQYINESIDSHLLPVNKRCLLERVKNRRIRHSAEEYFQIREQINQRHKQMFKEFIRPKIPNDFQETIMARKHYLIAPLYRTWSMPNPKSFGIQRRNVPNDLQGVLADLFDRQEDERYQLKVRQQVERDKLILSHEQDILRHYCTSTHSISFCSILKDEEIYDVSFSNEKSIKETPSFIKWIEESNLKYERLSCEITRRHDLEATTLNSMQQMVWRKYLSKENFLQLTDRYVPRIEIPSHFFSHYPVD